MSGPARLAVGDWVRFEAEDHRVLGLKGSEVRLLSTSGKSQVVWAAELMASGDLEAIAPPDPASVEGTLLHHDLDALMDCVPKEELARVRRLEGHLLEVTTGHRQGTADEDEQPNPLYAPGERLATKMEQKVQELAGTDQAMSARTLWRLLARYRELGAFGLVDQRRIPFKDPFGNIDARLRAAIYEQSRIEVEESSAGSQRFFNRVERRLKAQYGADAPAMPQDRTFRRNVNFLLTEQNPKRDAIQRRSAANRPPGLYGRFHATRPGEVVMFDTTRFDCLCYDPILGLCESIELTIAVCLQSRSILAWRFTPKSASAVDTVMLLADMLTPERMRAGWADSLRHRHYGPHVQRAYSLDQRMEAAAARPVIWPETILIDNGKSFKSEALAEGCRKYGITLQFARLQKPTDKPQVERLFLTIRKSFGEHVAGYKGQGVAQRGAKVESVARFSVAQIEDFFAEWVVSVYQRKPQEGLRLPGAPQTCLSPNDMYSAGVAVAGAIPMPTSSPYHSLLPIEWRLIRRDGVQINNLVYDGHALDGLRGVLSPYPNRNGDWPIHVDPRNMRQVFFLHPETGVWHALKWVHADDATAPFSLRMAQYVMNELASRGREHPDAAEVKAALRSLQDRTDAPEAATAKDKRALLRDRERVRSGLDDEARANRSVPEAVPVVHPIRGDHGKVDLTSRPVTPLPIRTDDASTPHLRPVPDAADATPDDGGAT